MLPINIIIMDVVMAEWLRRWTRNPMGYSLTGSNPVHDEIFLHYNIFFLIIYNIFSISTMQTNTLLPSKLTEINNVIIFV